MKYILNETPVRTSNNYKINSIELELEIPEIKNFGKYEIIGSNYHEYDKDNFESKIGLKLPKYHVLDIEVDKDTSVNFDIKDILVDQINLNIIKSSNITIKYDGNGFHHLKLIINSKSNIQANINIINILGSGSKSLIAIESYINDYSNITINYIDLGGNIRVSNYYSKLNNNSTCSFNNIYLGNDDDRIDMNYYCDIVGVKAYGYINVYGALNDCAYKTFKGTIDFKKESKKSIGKENENVILLSDNVVTRSLPMLLCHEEDVEGSHGVSTGKIDNDKLFYLMSRGISEKEAKKTIIKSNFNVVLENLTDDLKEKIIKIIDSKI